MTTTATTPGLGSAGRSRWQQPADGVGRQVGLGQEPDGGTLRDQLGEVVLGVGGEQDHRRWRRPCRLLESPGELEAALAGQVDVDQRDVRSEPFDLLQRLDDAGGDPDDGDPLALEVAAGGLQEAGAVVNEEAAQLHATRITAPAARGYLEREGIA